MIISNVAVMYRFYVVVTSRKDLSSHRHSFSCSSVFLLPMQFMMLPMQFVMFIVSDVYWATFMLSGNVHRVVVRYRMSS